MKRLGLATIAFVVLFADPSSAKLEIDFAHAHKTPGLQQQPVPDREVAHFTRIISRHPQDDDAYFRRGIANLYSGAPSRALADVTHAAELDPSYPYYALWADILSKRNHRQSGLAQAISRIDMAKWPAPIVRLFLGEGGSAAVLAAARDPDVETQASRLCEANFYIGEVALEHGAHEVAARRFRLAATNCPHGVDFVEGPAAEAELRALGPSP